MLESREVLLFKGFGRIPAGHQALWPIKNIYSLRQKMERRIVWRIVENCGEEAEIKGYEKI